ncbi:MAG: hypothetical protein ACO1PI_12280 [Bacteroidota bacterium]
MKKVTCIVAGAILLASCATSKLSNKSKEEKVKMAIDQRSEVINYAQLERQQIPTVSNRIANDRDRGILTAGLVTQAVSLGANAVKQLIANENKKYMAEYQSGLTGLFFYDQLSIKSAFDPIGMQFGGFTFVRTFTNKEGKTDTAIVARFSIVTDSMGVYDIFNNSFFKLRLDSIEVRYAKAKVSGSRWYMPWTLYQKKEDEKLHLDFEITFTTNYVNKQGNLFNNMELGKFYLNLRNAPINKSNANYAEYYNNLRGEELDGFSFVVPRSFGYYFHEGDFRECYSRGLYNIVIKVKESSKDKFVDQLIMTNSNQIVDQIGTTIKREAEKAIQPDDN